MVVAMKWTQYAVNQMAAFGLGGLAVAILWAADWWAKSYDEAKSAGVVR